MGYQLLFAPTYHLVLLSKLVCSALLLDELVVLPGGHQLVGDAAALLFAGLFVHALDQSLHEGNAWADRLLTFCSTNFFVALPPLCTLKESVSH